MTTESVQPLAPYEAERQAIMDAAPIWEDVDEQIMALIVKVRVEVLSRMVTTGCRFVRSNGGKSVMCFTHPNKHDGCMLEMVAALQPLSPQEPK